MKLHYDFSHLGVARYRFSLTFSLDGVEQSYVASANGEPGVIERYVLDEDNQPRVANGEVCIEVLRGLVEIRFHDIDDDACRRIKNRTEQLVEEAKRLGVVVTVTQAPRAPLAMGNYETVVSVRPVRERSE